MAENETSSTDDFRSLNIFGNDVSQIPCFRNSYLYGIVSGVGVGIVTFFGTSRPRRSMHLGFATFFTVTFGYWFSCRYNYSKTNFEMMQLQSALRKHQLYEGTEVEKEINRKAESA